MATTVPATAAPASTAPPLEAEPLLIDGYHELLGSEHDRTINALRWLIELYEGWGRPHAAILPGRPDHRGHPGGVVLFCDGKRPRWNRVKGRVRRCTP